MSQTKWRNVAQILLDRNISMRTMLTTELIRIRVQFFCIFLIMSITSLVMTIVNILTGWHLLMLSTLVFTIVSAIDVILSLINQKCEKVAQWLFAIEALLLCTFFIVFGEPEGFSAIWSLLLPTGGMLLFRRKKGSIICAVQCLSIIFLLWTPLGRSLLQYRGYSDSFLLRFPLLYISFFAVGFFLEHVRETTQRELTDAREKFSRLSQFDMLTGVYNRTGFEMYIREECSQISRQGMALAILDIDNFKTVNDTYGHNNGDVVLREIAGVVAGVVGNSGAVCRWGGEEFAILFLHDETARDICEKILQGIRDLTFNFNGRIVKITVSLGLTEFILCKNQDPLVHMTVADGNLYTAKANGKDRMVATKINQNGKEE